MPYSKPLYSDSLEQEFRERTIGLVTAQEFRRAREVVDKAQIESLQNEEVATNLTNEIKLKKKAEKRKRMMSALSFDVDPEEEEDNVITVPKRVMKNPEVDTSHLPDRIRDEQLEKEKERLRTEWLAQQEIIKQEVCLQAFLNTISWNDQMMEVVYSFWDGSGHRKAIELKKGCTIGKFLEYAKLQLSPDFPEIRCIGSDSLMYVKEDLIIPPVRIRGLLVLFFLICDS